MEGATAQKTHNFQVAGLGSRRNIIFHISHVVPRAKKERKTVLTVRNAS
jgi:hypothetical protein